MKRTGRIRTAFERYLKEHGLRLSGPRRLILEHLLASGRHLSAKEIHDALRGRGVGRVTVFRTLRLLERCGLAGGLTGRSGEALLELADRPHHDHALCLRCGRIQELAWPRLEALQEQACRRIGFQALRHRHVVFGFCRACARARRA